MADFVAVLKKTIEGLSENTPEARERVYAKARTTIDAKLSALNPPPPAVVAERQRRAINDAIQSVEAEHSKNIADPQNRSPTANKPPPIPQLAAGPKYHVVDQKLAVIAAPPGAREIGRQRELHRHIGSAAAQASLLIERSANRFPQLAETVRQYREAVDRPTESLSVVSVWALGTSLNGYADAYRRQNVERTLSEPLEPDVEASLATLVRLHGALMLGFEESANLIRQADAFSLDRSRLEEIAPVGNNLIAVLTDQEFVADDTRAVHLAVANFVHEMGWTVSRGGFAAYRIIENATIALLQALLPSDRSALTVIAAAATIDPNYSLIRVLGPMVLQQSSNFLIFFEHSPELRAYLAWWLQALHELESRERN